MTYLLFSDLLTAIYPSRLKLNSTVARPFLLTIEYLIL